MSNYLAPATVTAALKIALENAIAADMTDISPNATIGRPDQIDADGDKPGVNIYLYQVSSNVAWRGADLPTRDARGNLVQRPRAALDLHYLLTFFGDDAALEPQRLMGSVVSALHDRPWLTRDMIEETLADPDFNTILAGSDLSNEVERVKFTSIPLSLEELSKLWSVFVETPYQLSIAYLASVVFVERQVETGRALPVQIRTVTAEPSVDLAAAISPADLSGLVLWLKSDMGVTYDSDGVSDWADQSGNDNHAQQSDAARRPSFIAHGLGTIPVLRFDGVDDYLAILNLNYSGAQAGVTIFALTRSAADQAQVLISFDAARYWQLTLHDGAGDPRASWQTADTGAVSDSLTSTRNLVDTQWHVVNGRFEATAAPDSDKQLIVDGQVIREDNAHNGDSLGSGTRFGFIGAASQATAENTPLPTAGFLAGDVAEIVLYNRALTNEERDSLEAYFAGRYE